MCSGGYYNYYYIILKKGFSFLVLSKKQKKKNCQLNNQRYEEWIIIRLNETELVICQNSQKYGVTIWKDIISQRKMGIKKGQKGEVLNQRLSPE